MTTTPDSPAASGRDDQDAPADAAAEKPVGAEIGMTSGEGSTFEPEEDPEAQA
jgi:hypothetical protein